MISAALFSATFLLEDNTVLNVSAEDISVFGFSFHTSRDDRERFSQQIRECRVRVNGFESKAEIILNDCMLEDDGNHFLRCSTSNKCYQQAIKELMLDVASYTRRKNEDSDAELSHYYTSYPADKDNCFSGSFAQWRYDLLSCLSADQDWHETAQSVKEICADICMPQTLEEFLMLPFDQCWEKMVSRAGLFAHPIASITPNVVMAGNLYCPHLIPDSDQLARFLARCIEQDLKPVLALPPISEDRIEWVTKLLDDLSKMSTGHLEIVIGDIGLALLIRDKGWKHLNITAGPLLSRRRKDPRIRWWLGNPEALSESTANGAVYQQYLQQIGIDSITFEACGYPVKTTQGSILHLPFYQVNTASLCTLKAVCETGERGMQRQSAPCRQWCTENCFLYGEHLNAIGKGNTVFGADTQSLTDSQYLKNLLEGGTKRIVFELL